MCAAGRSFAMAYLCVYIIHGGEDGYGYPAFGAAKTLEFEWMWPLLVRNLAATWLIAGGWDWFLYFSPMAAKMKPFKLNTTYPSMSQFMHDSFMTTTASVCGTFIEVILCHLYATGDYPRHLADQQAKHVILALTITHWRIPHFYLIHRGMHPWRTKYFPDVGRFLYRHVHALHHKSYNPTAFSGTSMHPVEATAYYSAAFVILPANVHITIPLACIIDCGVGAWLGHDGFQVPGVGDVFH